MEIRRPVIAAEQREDGFQPVHGALEAAPPRPLRRVHARNQADVLADRRRAVRDLELRERRLEALRLGRATG